MDCLRCNTVMNFGSLPPEIPAAYCPSCEGLWLGRESMGIVRAKSGLELPADASADWNVLGPWKDSSLSCPDDSITLRTVNFKGVEVEICPSCTGLWLDKGEWKQLVSSRLKGAKTAAVAGALLFGGAVALGSSPDDHKNATFKADEGLINVGDTAVEAAGGIFDWATDMLGDVFSSALDVF